MNNDSVIIANITAADNEKFHAAHIPYSGSTGLAPRPSDPNAPYIATYLSELPRALKAMGWEHISFTFSGVTFSGEQWIVRRHEAIYEACSYRPEVARLLRIAELCMEMAVRIELSAGAAKTV